MQIALLHSVAGVAQEAQKETFAQLLARAKKADPELDFTALRMAYAASDQYSPYGGDRSIFEKALQDKNHQEALRLGEAEVEKDFLNVWAHWAAWQGAQGLGDETRAAFHQYALRGIFQSIVNSGDGKSQETAYHVLSTDETYFVLAALGLRTKSQALQHKDGHSYDAMTVVDVQSGTELTLYFNIDISFGYMQRLLGDPKKKKE